MIKCKKIIITREKKIGGDRYRFALSAWSRSPFLVTPWPPTPRVPTTPNGYITMSLARMSHDLGWG